MIEQVAPTDSPVLLLGETGVGKEVIAAAVHRMSRRSEGPFIKVDCGAIPESIMDSELFGHEKGAFTGASARRRGPFERAKGGTILLDEIGELSPQVQVRLLRVLQEKRIERVGGSEPLSVDIRIVAATHRDLERMVAGGGFREDLWFRLNVFPVPIPPLRERLEDLPDLVSHFARLKATGLNYRRVPEVEADALEHLRGHPWPGNVRELENAVERALIGHQGSGRKGALSARDFSFLQPSKEGAAAKTQARGSGDSLPTLDEAMAAHIRRALELSRGKIHGPGGAAERLGVKATTLRHRMDRLGIPYRKNAGT
jgi:transcriptional regulator with GAF, ATPase, and Fis domain